MRTRPELACREPDLAQLDERLIAARHENVEISSRREHARHAFGIRVNDQYRRRNVNFAGLLIGFHELNAEMAGKGTGHVFMIADIRQQVTVIIAAEIEQYQILANVRAVTRYAVPPRWCPQRQVLVEAFLVE